MEYVFEHLPPYEASHTCSDGYGLKSKPLKPNLDDGLITVLLYASRKVYEKTCSPGAVLMVSEVQGSIKMQIT